MEKVSLKYGVYIALGLIVYFLLVRIFGLHENPWLRVLNGAIVAFGIYRVIKNTKTKKGNNFTYFYGFKIAILSGFTATIIFVIFMGIYMFHLDASFANKIMSMGLQDYANGPGILLFIILIEGFASVVVLSLLFMQKFKPSWNIS